MFTDIRLYAVPAVLYFSLRLYFILSLVSTTHFPYPNGAVILNFYRAKVVTAGNTENTGTLLATNFSGPSEIKDCGFLKNLQANYLPCVSFEPTLLPAHKRFEMTVTPE